MGRNIVVSMSIATNSDSAEVVRLGVTVLVM